MQLLKLCLILSLTLTLIACSRNSEDAAAEKVKEETAEAYEALKAYGASKRQEFEQQARTTLQSLDKQFEELKGKAEVARGEAKKHYEAAINEWNKKKSALVQKLDEFRNTSADTWESMEKQIESGMEDLKKFYEDTKSALT